MEKFMTKEELDKLSYTSTLGTSLKQISLRKTELQKILEDIDRWRTHRVEMLVNEHLIGMRFKSDDSIMRKYEKTLKTGGGFKQCFNDVLGFRMQLDEYPTEFPEYFRVVDLRDGKQIDDGYRAIHLYYQRDSYSYPIEIQLWCGREHQFNIWAHKHTYKYKNEEIGKKLYNLYIQKKISSEDEFISRLEEMEK